VFLHVALEVVDDSSAFLANGVIKSVVAATVAVLEARAVLNKVADSFQVAFGGSNAKGSAAIVVVGIDLPALDVKNLHGLNVVIEGSVVKTILLVSKVLKANRNIGRLNTF